MGKSHYSSKIWFRGEWQFKPFFHLPVSIVYNSIENKTLIDNLFYSEIYNTRLSVWESTCSNLTVKKSL